MISKMIGLIGLSQRAGKLRSGEFAVEKSVKEGKSKLVIVSGDASENTRKKFRDMCTFRHIPYAEYGTMAELGRAAGRSERSSLSVEDEGFAEQMKKYLNGGSANVE